jgi:hypothetical protein
MFRELLVFAVVGLWASSVRNVRDKVCPLRLCVVV